MLFLHGAGERGHDLEGVKTHGLPKLVARGEDLPCLVVSPQCPAGAWWTELVPELLGLVDEVSVAHRVDRDRVYVTGLSMGGYGCWAVAAAAPERFAAAIPICGGGKAAWAPRLRRMPIWAFHGREDDVVPLGATETMVKALEAVGAPVRLTVYDGVGHDSWTRTYDDPAVLDWLLAQRRA